jgi:hypothetical protein
MSLPSVEPCVGSETASEGGAARLSVRRMLRHAGNAAIVLGLLTCGWAL